MSITGYKVVTAKQARQLNGGALPERGREALVLMDGQYHWLSHDRYENVWAVMPTAWRMVGGRMVLDDVGIRALDQYITNLSSQAVGLS